MLYRPEDAEDATQEIQIKIITHLDSFEGRSRFQELDELGRVTALFRSHPEYAAPDAFVGIVKQLVDSPRFELFNNH